MKDDRDRAPPQAFSSTVAPRLRTFANSILSPSGPTSTAQNVPGTRTTKRGTTAINYAEDGYDDDDLDDADGGLPGRRFTGLRSLRREAQSQDKLSSTDRMAKDLTQPAEVQGIWRDWMTRPKLGRSDEQFKAQSLLPVVLVPIRLELDIAPFTPHPAFPLPHNSSEFGVDPMASAYRVPEMVGPLRFRDFFCWNLYEALLTPDQFALGLVNDLDLPNAVATAMQISQQIRQQLEEFAAIALHPMFPSPEGIESAPANESSSSFGGFKIPPKLTGQTKRSDVQGPASTTQNIDELIKVTAQAMPSSVDDNPHDLEDASRCMLTMDITLHNKHFSDRFEWSLQHPAGTAEEFAQLTCADMGIGGEWVPALAHGIHDAIYRYKKDVFDSGGLHPLGDVQWNYAAEGQDAGWRVDHENLGESFAPKMETLSKEEIEKRDIDRERQIRRIRRDTARFSSSAYMMGGAPSTPAGGGGGGGGVGIGNGFFDTADSVDNNPVNQSSTPAMGRGERSKKKRRFRSLSPAGRVTTVTTGAGGTPDVNGGGGGSGYYGGGVIVGGLNEWERASWRCNHCLTWGNAVWAVRDGPKGPKTLCQNCHLLYERDKCLPRALKDYHRGVVPLGR